MSTVIRNVGAMEGQNTNQTKALGLNGVSRFVFEGVEFSCGVNATVTVEDRIANAWLTADTRMKFESRS